MLFRELETAALEALLFVAKNPLTVELLGDILALDVLKVEELLQELRNRYTMDACVLKLLEINGGYTLGTKPEVARYIEILYK